MQRDAGQASSPSTFRGCSARAATSRSTAASCEADSPNSPRKSRPQPAGRRRRSRSPTVSSTSRSATWPTRSSGSRSQRGHDVTRYTLHRVRRRRRPARLPGGRRAWHDDACSCIRSPACCPPTAWASPTRPRCVRRPIEAALDEDAMPGLDADAGRAGCAGHGRADGAGVRPCRNPAAYGGCI